MKVFTERLNSCPAHQEIPELPLSFDIRQKSRFRAIMPNGEAIGVDLPRTGVLRGGSCLATESGEVVKIMAAPQTLMKVTATNFFDLMKAAYHLGNRHVVLMLTQEALYFEPDHVLSEMLQGLGLRVANVEHQFEPESGAYMHPHHETRLRPVNAPKPF